MTSTLFRQLPSVEQLLQTGPAADLLAAYGRPVTLEALRGALERAREAIRDGRGTPFSDSELLSAAEAHLTALLAPTLRPVINATGVIIHTNLGRAPLSAAARAAIGEAAAGATTRWNTTWQPGARGSRSVHAQGLLARLTGAEAALCVNNNAAAVLLTLDRAGPGREVIISRGQLVEIGGRLSHAGRDGPSPAPSWSRSAPPTAPTCATIEQAIDRTRDGRHSWSRTTPISRSLALPPSRRWPNWANWPTSTASIVCTTWAAGPLHRYRPPMGWRTSRRCRRAWPLGPTWPAFSGDKLLGGPQAGLIVGRAELLDRIKRHPLARAVRPDKLCLAGLPPPCCTISRTRPSSEIPIWRMIAARPRAQPTARRWVSRLERAGLRRRGRGRIDGGRRQPARHHAADLVGGPGAPAARRTGSATAAADPPVIGRIEGDRLLLDPRTVLPEQEKPLLRTLQELVSFT